jgi:hypothetical protein
MIQLHAGLRQMLGVERGDGKKGLIKETRIVYKVLLAARYCNMVSFR